MTTSTPKFRLIGTTSDVVECERCGKPDLRSTVILEWLDDEGNGTGEHTYYGSVCASYALADRGIKATPASIRKSAKIAQERRHEMADWARLSLAHFGIPATGDVDTATLEHAVDLYAKANYAVRDWPRDQVRQQVQDRIVEWRRDLTDAA